MKCLTCGVELPEELVASCPHCHAVINIEQTLAEDAAIDATVMIDGEDAPDPDADISQTIIVEEEDIEQTVMIDGDGETSVEDDIGATYIEENGTDVEDDLDNSIYDMHTLPDSPENVRSDDHANEGSDTFQDEIEATYVGEVDHDQVLKTITDLWSDNVGEGDYPTTSLKADVDPSFDLRTVSDLTAGDGDGTRDVSDRTMIEGEEEISRNELVVKSRIFRGVDLDAETAEDADYEVVRVLGEGGMGTVYEANQTSIDRSVAVKTLKPSMAKSSANTEKFLSEAVVTGDLDHPNIVPIYDLGTNHLGEVFYSMLCVSGTPWDEVIKEKSLSENIEIFMKVADAVAFAHSRGVIHRDLKPENTMLGSYGEVLVMDWGLALTTPQFRKQTVQLKAGSIGGTPAYMSPEMAKGEVHHIDAKSDVYLLGAILYEIITGKPPHYGKDVMKCLFSAGKNEIRATQQSGELVEIALKAMATNPKDRFATVLEFQKSIREYLSHTESIALSTRAETDLKRAEETAEYEDYSRARFGFQESENLWAGNTKAVQGFKLASMKYASCALQKSDFDLGLSLLNANDPEQAVLHTQLLEGQRERDARVQRLKWMQQVGMLLAAVVLVTVSVAFFWIRAEKQAALHEKKLADVARDEAVVQRKQADIARDDALTQKKRADDALIQVTAQKKKTADALVVAVKEKQAADIAKEKAVAAEKIAVIAKKKADDERVKAIAAEKVAVDEKKKADIAKEQAITAQKVAVIEKKKADEERLKADKAKEIAVTAQKVAVMEKKKADEERTKAIAAQKIAVAAEKVAVTEKKKADIAKEAAIAAEKVAVVEKKKADEERIKAVEAKKAEEYEAYIAQIGLAAAKIQENSFESALTLLRSCNPELRNWEWGRLMHLCSQGSSIYPAEAPVNSVAISPDGTLIASGGWNGLAIIRNRQTGKVVQQLKHDGLYVHAVTFSPDGKQLASGSNDRKAYLQVWDIATGEKVQTFQGHTDAILSVQFSQDGSRLLSASFDHSARIWNVKTGKEIQKLLGHTWWVWSAMFQPSLDEKPEQKIVTCSQDGTAVVWEDETGNWNDIKKVKQSSPFREHRGPVYSAVFSPDGKLVASGGGDRRLLLWNPEDVPKDDYRKLVAGVKRDQTPFREFAGHIKAVRSVSFSEDGKLLLSGSHDNTVKVWSVEQKRAIKTFRGHAGWVRSCQFSPDGRWIVSGSHDNTTRIWNIANYEEIRVLQGRALQGHYDAVLAASFSPDGKQVLTASRDRTAKIWSFEDGSEETTFSEGHAYLASSVRFSPNGKELFTAAVDDTVRMWDVTTGTEIALLKKTGRNASLAVSANGKWLVTGGENKTAKIWSVMQMKQAAGKGENLSPLLILRGHQSDISVIAISPDNQTVYTGDVHGHAKLWNLATGKLLHQLEGHSRKIVAASFLPDGKQLLTASEDNTVGLWNVLTGKEDVSHVLKHPDSVIEMTVSPDGKTVYTSCLDGLLRTWSLADAKQTGIIGMGNLEYNALNVSVDGKLLLAVDSDSQTVRLFDLNSGKEVASLPGTGTGNHFLDFKQQGGQLWSARFSPDGQHLVTIGGNEARLWNVKSAKEEISFSPHGAVAAASFSPDGKQIVTASWDNSAKVWETQSGRAVRKLQGSHTSYVNDAIFSPDGTTVLTASDDGTIKMWGMNNGKVLKTFSGHVGGVWKVVYSENGKQILTASADKTARLWDVAAGKTLMTLSGHKWGVLCVDIMMKKQLAITGSEDNTARVWDLKTGKSLFKLSGHTARVTSVAFSPDGSRILTASADNTAKLWDANTGKEILTLAGHQREITSIRFSPDGKTVLTASRDGKAIVWLTKK